jgi:hypothetical protein
MAAVTYHKGMRVHLFSEDGKRELGFGTIEELETVQWLDKKTNKITSEMIIPKRIRLENGKMVRGDMCLCFEIKEEQ